MKRSLAILMFATCLPACSGENVSTNQFKSETAATTSKIPGGKSGLADSERPASVSSMPRAKTESILGLPTDLLGNGNLRRGFFRRKEGLHPSLTSDLVGVFSDLACVRGNTVETPRNVTMPNGFNPLDSDSLPAPSQILGFDVNTKMRDPSIETDLAEFIKRDEKTDVIFYNPVSYVRAVSFLKGANILQFDGQRCGSVFVDKVAYVGRLIVLLKISYRSPEERAKFEERFHPSTVEFAKMLTEIRSDPASFGSVVKFSMAAYQVGGDIKKLAANFGGASHIECTPADLSACEGVYKNIGNYSTDIKSGFPSQLTRNSRPGPMALPIGFGEVRDVPMVFQSDTLL